MRTRTGSRPPVDRAPRGRVLRSAAAAALGALAVLGLGCGPTGQSAEPRRLDAGLDLLQGGLVSNRSVLVVPGRRFSGDEGSGRWTFRTFARLHCWVGPEGTSGRDLRIELQPDAESVRQLFTASWDGEKLGEEADVLEAPDAELRIPAALLTPGVHELELRRSFEHEPPAERAVRESGLEHLAYGLAGQVPTELEPAQLSRLGRVAAFLAFGLTGGDTQRLSGCLFDGPGAVTTAVGWPQSTHLELTVENGSSSPATFTAASGAGRAEATVPAGQRARLELPFDPGPDELTLSVRGEAPGLYMWGAPYLEPASSGDRAPVVLITLDTTRRDALSPYGGPVAASPNLARFAATATLFTDAHATSPWTLPSHASIFTGLYPSMHHGGVSSPTLPAAQQTLAELFRDHGYFTAGFAGGEMCASRWGVGQGFLRYRDPDGFETRGDVLTDAAEAFLRSHSDRPLFLFLNYFDPHALYRAPAGIAERFGLKQLQERIDHLPIWRDLARGDASAWSDIIAGRAEVNDEVLAYVEAAYLAEVAFMDSQLGRLMGVLEELDLFDRALVVVVADHGEFLGEHGFFSHACRLDPELTEIPMLVKWPGQRQPRVVDDLVSQVDLFPTVLTVLGGAVPSHNGISLTPPHGDSRTTRTAVYMEEHEAWFHPLYDSMRIAHHLYGIQRRHSREVVWQGGIQCATGGVGGWRDQQCPATWEERLAELAAVARLLDERAEASGSLSAEDEARLKALGYVQ